MTHSTELELNSILSDLVDLGIGTKVYYNIGFKAMSYDPTREKGSMWYIEEYPSFKLNYEIIMPNDFDPGSATDMTQFVALKQLADNKFKIIELENNSGLDPSKLIVELQQRILREVNYGPDNYIDAGAMRLSQKVMSEMKRLSSQRITEEAFAKLEKYRKIYVFSKMMIDTEKGIVFDDTREEEGRYLIERGNGKYWEY